MRIGIILFLLFNQPLITAAQHPDIILTGGKVFTSVRERPFVEAVAITGHLISATGTSEEIDKLAGPNTRVIKLEGRTVIPGINDAHYHHSPIYEGYTIRSPEDGSDPGTNALIESISTATRIRDKGTIIYGTLGLITGTDSSIHRTSLDKISPDHPLVLESFWGHTTILNSAALNYFGISEGTPEPMGGFFGRYGDGKLNGRFYEMACNVIRLKKPTNEILFMSSLEQLGREAAYYGITTIQNICSSADTTVYLNYLSKILLPVRMRLIHWETLDAKPDTAIKRDPPRFMPFTKLSGVKWMLDGTPIERFAALTEGYEDMPGWYGRLNYENKMDSIFKLLATTKEQPLLHVVGDHTIKKVLDQLEKTDGRWKNRRVRIEHADGLLPEDFYRAKALNLIAVINPSHLTFTDMLHARYGKQMSEKGESLKSLLSAGIDVALGSDGPLNPYLNIMFACMHPFRPSESLTREEAVIAYTRGSAFAENEDNKGTIEKGKLADLVVLSSDLFSIPLQDLPSLRSIFTIMNGRIIYRGGYKKD